MADTRFFASAAPLTLAQVAEAAGAEIGPESDPAREFDGVAPLSQAGGRDVSFLDNRRYIADLGESRAGACILHPDLGVFAPAGMAILKTPTPYRGFARVAASFHPPREEPGGQHASALVDPTAQVATGCAVGPGVVIGPHARVGEGCRIGAGAIIGRGVELGDGCEIGRHVSLEACLLGNRVRLHDGVRVGQRGFGFDTSDFPYEDVPQIGRVIIEEDVEVGANTTIDRGSASDTVIGAGSRLDNLVQIGHNVRLGRGCILVAQVGIAGSTVLEDFVVVGGQAGIAGHLRLGRGAQVGAKAGVMSDIPPGGRVAGFPAMPSREYFRLVASLRRRLKSKDT
jgi:UDP-3-O-[3-hydroxymyristoyl] glucosamine N-acyltransferase